MSGAGDRPGLVIGWSQTCELEELASADICF